MAGPALEEWRAGPPSSPRAVSFYLASFAEIIALFIFNRTWPSSFTIGLSAPYLLSAVLSARAAWSYATFNALLTAARFRSIIVAM